MTLPVFISLAFSFGFPSSLSLPSFLFSTCSSLRMPAIASSHLMCGFLNRAVPLHIVTAAVKEDLIYKLLKNTLIKGDCRFPLDLYTPADIVKCLVLNSYFYFRGAFWILYYEPFCAVILHKIHDSPIISHPARENTFALLVRNFY